MSRYRFIAVEKAKYPVALLCRVLHVASSGYYAWRHRQPSRRSQANAALTAQIRTIHERSRGTYGAPRIHAELHADQPVSRKRIARLMRAAGLAGRPPRQFRRTTFRIRRFSSTTWYGAISLPVHQTGSGSATSPTSARGTGCTWRSSTRTAARSSAGPWLITCAPSWPRLRSRWR
ncbi:MAG: transposase [Chloroflexi bacterium]|nr:transposase [Chloroflexota bacterium]